MHSFTARLQGAVLELQSPGSLLWPLPDLIISYVVLHSSAMACVPLPSLDRWRRVASSPKSPWPSPAHFGDSGGVTSPRLCQSFFSRHSVAPEMSSITFAPRPLARAGPEKML